MKKALSTAILATMILTTSLWAEESTQKTPDKQQQEIRQQQKDLRNSMNSAIKDIRKEQRDELKKIQSECLERLENANTDTEKDAIKVDCKADIRATREALRENIKALKKQNYTTLLENFKTQLSSKFDSIKSLPEDKKAEWKEKMNERLDEMEDKANASENDSLILTISAIRETIYQM